MRSWGRSDAGGTLLLLLPALAVFGGLFLYPLGLTALTGFAGEANAAPAAGGDPKQKTRTRFQIACMTLPYSRFPLQRALQGIRKAGYQHVTLDLAGFRKEPSPSEILIQVGLGKS